MAWKEKLKSMRLSRIAAAGAVWWVMLALGAGFAAWSIVTYGGLLKAEVEGEKKLYTCPMHPDYISDQPGDCPICGMTLVPVEGAEKEAGHEHAGGAAEAGSHEAARAMPQGLAPVHLDARKIQLIGVKTVKAQRTELARTIESYAVVEVAEESVAKVHARTAGWVTAVKVKRSGQKVKKGQVLFSLYSPDAFQAQQEYALLLARMGQASQLPSIEVQKDAARVKLDILGVPGGVVKRLEKTLKPSKTIPVLSPARGYALLKNLYTGMYVMPDTEVLEIADLSKVWVSLKVHQDLSGLVKEGDDVAFRTDVFPGEVFKGQVDQIYPELDPGLRSRDVRVVISNEDGRLAPGMYGAASIDVEAFEGIALPEDAVIFGGVTNYVFIAKGGGHFEPSIVETGIQTGGRVQILSGVEEGDEVVSSSNFLLDSESKLKGAVGGFGESGAETAGDMGHMH